MDERLRRTAEVLREIGADWAVLTGVDSVAYALGRVAPIETGPSPFGAGPCVGLVGADGATGLLLADGEVAPDGVGAVVHAPGYGRDQSAPPLAAFSASLRELLRRLGVAGAVAVEPESCPLLVADALPSGPRPALGAAFRRARAVKTPWELEALRRSAALAGIGQRALPGALAAGRTELDVFAALRQAMENAAGERLAVAGDLLSGPARTAAVGGWPGTRRLAQGDAVLADLAPRIGGYWGDSCATVVLGRASGPQRRLFEAARAGLDHALATLRPGLGAAALHGEVRREVRARGFDYPHHTGHSIGTAVHEHPRLCAAEDMVLQADMVLMIEPGAYHPDIGGARTEWMVRVTATGCEPVCPFPLAVQTDASAGGAGGL